MYFKSDKDHPLWLSQLADNIKPTFLDMLIVPHVYIISQSIYLDLSEYNEILYLGSRDVYISHL